MTGRKPIICAKCSKKVFPYCTNPECVKWREEMAQQTIRECFAITGGLAERLFKENSAGTQADYQEIKKVQEKISKLTKEREWNSFIKADIEELKQSCQDLAEEYISPKDRHLVDNKGKISINKICCRSGDIEKDKDGNFYCSYCWEKESSKFLQSLKSYLLDEFNKTYLREKSGFDFKSSQNHKSLLENQFTTQEEAKKLYQKLQEELRINSKESQINNNTAPNRERERAENQTLTKTHY